VKLAISNIAWAPNDEAPAADLMRVHGFTGVEVAPGKIGPRPAELNDGEIARYREFWNSRGISIVAMQALLFGQNDLAIFGAETSRRAMSEYLARIIRLGGLLGARALVFGSPKNRRVEKLTRAQIDAIALPFFRELGRIAKQHATCLCIEPNPAAYGADWILDATSARELVLAVDHPGFGLHLDGGALHMASEGPDVIRRCGGLIRHFHASMPELAPVRAGGPTPHETFAKTLREMRYPRWVSIEMRQPADAAATLPQVEAALAYVKSVYGD
jgi:sugar phosphate isomerase/epimerase